MSAFTPLASLVCALALFPSTSQAWFLPKTGNTYLVLGGERFVPVPPTLSAFLVPTYVTLYTTAEMQCTEGQFPPAIGQFTFYPPPNSTDTTVTTIPFTRAQLKLAPTASYVILDGTDNVHCDGETIDPDNHPVFYRLFTNGFE